MTLNIAILIIIIVAGVLGYRKGMLQQVGAFAGIVVGVIACRLLYPVVIGRLFTPTAEQPSPEVMTVVLTHVAIFAVAYLIVRLIAYSMHQLLHQVKLGLFDHLGGAVFNALQWLFMISLLMNAWVSVAPTHAPADKWGERIMALAPAIIGSETASELWHTMTDKQLVDPKR